MSTNVPSKDDPPRAARRQIEKFAFTERILAALERPTEGSRYIYDAVEAGLGVRLTPSRSRYIFYRWHRGKPDRLTLDKVGGIRLREVRRIVAGYRGELAKGVDVFARERQAKKKPAAPATLNAAFEAHIARPDMRATTRGKYRSLWRRVPATLAQKPIADIGEDELKQLHATIGARHQRTADLVLTVISILLRHNGRRHDNPGTAVKRYRHEPRQRVLTLDELHRFRDALEQENEPWPTFFLLLLLTGARRGGLARMRWQDLDLDGAVWRLPASWSKNRKVLAVALAVEAVAILRKLWATSGASPWVFPARSKAGHIAAPTPAWNRICIRAGIAGAVPHDLRRTIGTAIASDGANASTVAAVLGHASQQSAKAYIHLSAEVGRDALERVARRTIRAA
jgi:integrase